MQAVEFQSKMEELDTHSFPPARAPKKQLAVEQPLIGGCWNPPKKDSPCPKQQQDGRKGAIQFSSVAQLCSTLCSSMNHSTSGLPIHHHLLESIQTHVHWVGDAIQPAHPLSSPSSPALNLSQHQGLLKWVSSSHQVAKAASTSVPTMNTQDWSALGWTGWISLQSKGLSRVFSNTTVQKHQFFGAQLSL